MRTTRSTDLRPSGHVQITTNVIQASGRALVREQLVVQVSDLALACTQPVTVAIVCGMDVWVGVQ